MNRGYRARGRENQKKKAGEYSTDEEGLDGEDGETLVQEAVEQVL